MKKLLTALPLLAAVIAAFIWLNANHADAGRVEQIEQRLDAKILYDERSDIQKRMWTLEDRYGEPAKQLPEYRELILDKEEIDSILKGDK